MENATNENECVYVNYCYGVEVIDRSLIELTWGAMDLDLHLPSAMTAAAAAKCRVGAINDAYDFEADRTRQLTVLVAYFFAQVGQPGNPLLFEVVLDADSADPRPVPLKGMLARDQVGAAFYVFTLPEEK